MTKTLSTLWIMSVCLQDSPHLHVHIYTFQVQSLNVVLDI